jgi:hypothetical protein
MARTRPALSLVSGDDQDQVPRLHRFREAHPGIVIGPLESGTWQAWFPAEGKAGRAVTRWSLRDLLDDLEDDLAGESG